MSHLHQALTISRPTPDLLLNFEEVFGSWSGVGQEMVGREIEKNPELL
jgi:hypothetical protein